MSQEEPLNINEYRLECSILFNTLKKANKYTTKLKCNHTFYTNPLIEWIKNCPVEIPTCPTCRKDFKIEDLLM